ncbi:phage portal protein [Niameybacter massiliensis]|uniref:phage portal protein n=1 Tax=Niameybacter massiliensis TaxID=1658108 RepID=UPI0006B46AD8|nr:phage portal protein [Niameybacter massiliensis]
MLGANYFNKLFKQYKQDKVYKELISIMNDGQAVFSEFGKDVYLSDFVNNCIDRIATEVSKINVVSVIQQTESVVQQNDDITKLFRFQPNPLQTTKDFLACCEWLRRKDYNCFIYPQYTLVKGANGKEVKKYTAFYPLNPTSIEIGVNTEGETWEIKFHWKDGTWDIIPYADVIHLKWRRGKNTVIGGGDDFGSPDTRDLLKSVKVLDQVIQGLPKSIEASLKVNGVYSAKSMVDSTKLATERDNFEKHIFSSKAGIVATDLSGEFTPVNIKPATVNDNILKFLKAILRERYGISESIISGDYNGEQHSAFYQSCIEDFIIEFEQAMSSTLFSQREQDIGHRVKGYYNKVSYLSTENKIKIAELATNTGLMSLNDVAEMFGMTPSESGNRRIQSLNYSNVELVDKYQLGKVGVEKDE